MPDDTEVEELRRQVEFLHSCATGLESALMSARADLADLKAMIVARAGQEVLDTWELEIARTHGEAASLRNAQEEFWDGPENAERREILHQVATAKAK